MDDPALIVLVVAVSLLFSAFFSGIEIAFISSDKLHIELLGQKGTLAGRILSRFQKRRSHFLATTLVGNNLALVTYGIFMAKLIEPFLVESLPEFLQGEVIILIIQSLISTILVLFTAEFIPKSVFLLNPDFLLTLFAVPMAIIYYVMYPVVYLVVVISNFIIRAFGFDYSEDKPVFGLTDLNNYIKKNVRSQDEQEEAEVDAKIFNNAIEFKEVKVRECMIPRTEII
ncbi:MAG: DUF21 domain-containing protein, partial [Cyclobacteriaceae bacterium]|nr:DUF21 domain-containing protein [Cyclobacteriaceae bacterium HetDA_MAG_MS6]